MVKLHQQQTANLRPSMRAEDNVTGLWQDHCAGELVVVVVAAVTT